jgi:hypothetical protein
MTHTYSELLGIRMYTRETKQRLSNLYAMLVSNEMQNEVFCENTLEESFDDAGLLCDLIEDYLTMEIWVLDARREMIREHVKPYEPRNRWEL